MALQSPIARVRGLGAARAGVGHWMRQRLTAIANVFLVLWFVFSAWRWPAPATRRCGPGSPRPYRPAS